MRYLIIGDIHVNMLRRFDDTIQLLDFIKQVATEASVDHILQLGDVYDTRRPYQQEMRVIESWVKGLPCPITFIYGNHDKTGNTSALGEFETLKIPGVKVFSSPHIENGVFMGHFGLKESVFGPVDFHLPDAVSMRDLLKQWPGCKAYFLGHIHRPQILNVDPLVMHAGSIDRVDFGERDEDKFVWIFDDVSKSLDRIKLPIRPMVQIVINTDGDIPVIDHDGAIVKVVIKGPPDKLSKFDESSIRKAFSKAYSLTIVYDVDRCKPVKAGSDVIREGVTAKEALREYVDGLRVEEGLKRKILDKGHEIILKVTGE
jgi:DNA repair exonuclease SbcCD nuclease subunit